jgi:hypothetical protein
MSSLWDGSEFLLIFLLVFFARSIKMMQNGPQSGDSLTSGSLLSRKNLFTG